jgi:galactose mutarotase-like enzyme
MVLGIIERAERIFILENGQIKLTIRPDLGGRIDQIQDVKTEREWLWHPADYTLAEARSLPIGASFDEHWSGGWDEIFPNDVAGKFQDYQLVDHGELWSQKWQVVATTAFSIKLKYQCQTIPVTVEKIVQLDPKRPEANILYQFHNQSDRVIPFLFKQHAAIAIEAGDEILLPDCWIEPAFLEFSKIIGQAGKTRFPNALAADGQEIQVQFIPPPSSKLQEFYYSSELAIGQCGIRHQRSQSSLIMQFDTTDFPFVWVFQSYGGWRDHYVLVMEPATTMPADLEIACDQGTAAQLQPQSIHQRRLTFRLERDESILS